MMLVHPEINQRLLHGTRHAARVTATSGRFESSADRGLETTNGSTTWIAQDTRWKLLVCADYPCADYPSDDLGLGELNARLAPLRMWIAQTVEEHPSGTDPMYFETGGPGWSTKLRWDIVPAWDVQDQLRRRLRQVGALLDVPGAGASVRRSPGRAS